MNIKPRDFGKKMKKWGKAYKKPVFVWSRFMGDNLDGYLAIGERKLKSWEVLNLLVKRKAGYRKVMLAVALFGEIVDDSEHEWVGLEPYREEDLYALISKIAERMEANQKAKFWELAGYTPEETQKVLLLIRNRWALHPMNVARAYGSIMEDVETWQEAVIRTFYFAQARSQLEQQLMQGAKGKLARKVQSAGLLKV